MRLAEHFRSRGITFSWASDEGMVVARGTLKGIATPLILLGTDEKGYVNLELSVSQNPGHSSRPPRNQAIARLGHTLSLLEKNPFPYQLIPSVRHFFEGLVPHAPFGLGMIFANLWITKPLLFLAMRMNPEGASMLRTTLAMTMLQGSKAENILPDSARAIINLRLLPGWTAEKALNRIRKAIADPQIKVSFQANALHSDPVIGHGTGDDGYAKVARAAAAAFPGLPVLPCLVTAQTDSRHYADICDSIVRFAPMELGKDELGLIHGHDERISIKNFESGIRFYLHLIHSLEVANHGE